MLEWSGCLDAVTPDDPYVRIPLQLTVTREVMLLEDESYSVTRIVEWHELSGKRLWSD